MASPSPTGQPHDRLCPRALAQDLAQVEEIYGKAWRTMFANARVKQLFGTSDLHTAKSYLS